MQLSPLFDAANKYCAQFECTYLTALPTFLLKGSFDIEHTLFLADLNDASVAHVLGLIFPKLEGQLMLAKNVQLIEALQEIQAHEKDTSFLSPQCQFILGKTLACQPHELLQ